MVGWTRPLGGGERRDDWTSDRHVDSQTDRRVMTAQGDADTQQKTPEEEQKSDVCFEPTLLSTDGQSHASSESVRAQRPQQQQRRGAEYETRLSVSSS